MMNEAEQKAGDLELSKYLVNCSDVCGLPAAAGYPVFSGGSVFHACAG